MGGKEEEGMEEGLEERIKEGMEEGMGEGVEEGVIVWLEEGAAERGSRQREGVAE